MSRLPIHKQTHEYAGRTCTESGGAAPKAGMLGPAVRVNVRLSRQVFWGQSTLPYTQVTDIPQYGCGYLSSPSCPHWSTQWIDKSLATLMPLHGRPRFSFFSVLRPSSRTPPPLRGRLAQSTVTQLTAGGTRIIYIHRACWDGRFNRMFHCGRNRLMKRRNSAV